MAYVSTMRPWNFSQEYVESLLVDGTPPGPFPIAMTWKDMFRIYYRVRKWKLTIAYAYSGSVPGEEMTYNESGGFSGDVILDTPMTSESQFATSVFGGSWSGSLLGGSWTGSTGGSGSINCSASLSFLSALADYEEEEPAPEDPPAATYRYKVEQGSYNPALPITPFNRVELGTYYPSLELLIGLNTGPLGGASFSSAQRLVFGTAANVQFIVDGASSLHPYSEPAISKNLVCMAVPADIDGGSVSRLMEASIEPLEWWEYDPGDGPVYDQNTGATLRNPFTIQFKKDGPSS
jgi:hypothetical protein